MNKSVAVIDIGSNTIKAIVATSINGQLTLLSDEQKEVRISTGISRENPLLLPESIRSGTVAVAELWRHCQEVSKISDVRVVATSAVRSATNGTEFIESVKRATGLNVEVLSGDEEADGIAAGIAQDPFISAQHKDFGLFDLGGGSLEFGRFQSGNLNQRTSLPLGAVRLTEKFISQPKAPIPDDEITALKAFLYQKIKNSKFTLSTPIIGTGGAVFVTRRILESRSQQLSPVLEKASIESLFHELKSISLEERCRIPHLPANRADILPVALLTFLAVLDAAEADSLTHSVYNLKFGLAARLLKLSWAF